MKAEAVAPKRRHQWRKARGGTLWHMTLEEQLAVGTTEAFWALRGAACGTEPAFWRAGISSYPRWVQVCHRCKMVYDQKVERGEFTEKQEP